MIGKIMKIEKPNTLFYMFNTITQQSKYNHSYVCFILIRLLEYENSKIEMEKHTEVKGINLNERVAFYRLIKSVEENIHRLKVNEIGYLLYSISNSSKTGISFDSLIFKIVELFLDNDNYELIENEYRLKIFFSFVKIRERKIFTETGVLDEIINKSISGIQRCVQDFDLDPEQYFKIAYYYYKVELKDKKLIAVLNKLLLKIKKQGTGVSFYYWFLMNIYNKEHDETVWLVLKEMVNRKPLIRQFNLKLCLSMLRHVEGLDFEQRHLLKKMLINRVMESIVAILSDVIEKKETSNKIKDLIVYLRENQIRNSQITEKLLQLYENGLFINTDDHYLVLYLFDIEHERKTDFLLKINKNLSSRNLDLNTIIELLTLYKQHDLSLLPLNKKFISVFTQYMYKLEFSDIISRFEVIKSFLDKDSLNLEIFMQKLKKELISITIINNTVYNQIVDSHKIKEVKNEYISYMKRTNRTIIKILWMLGQFEEKLVEKCDEYEDNFPALYTLIKERIHNDQLDELDIEKLVEICENSRNKSNRVFVLEMLNNIQLK